MQTNDERRCFFMKKKSNNIQRYPKKKTHTFPTSALEAAQRESEGYTGVEDTETLVEMAEEWNPDDFKEMKKNNKNNKK